MNWFKKLLPSKILPNNKKKAGVPEGLWNMCPSCQDFLFLSELERNLHVCPKCSHHFRIGARKRLDLFLDQERKTELVKDLKPKDILNFKDLKKYKDRLTSAQKETQENEALIVMKGSLFGLDLVATAFEFNFMGGSMGSIVGTKFVEAVNCCLTDKLPLVCFSSSGGARMQESVISLMQMAKTSAALNKLSKSKLPYISVMVDPCMGGVSASLAMLGDLNIAEPKALIGFTGPRVIQQTINENLPEGFQMSEFLLKKGLLDFIIDRRKMREKIYSILSILLKRKI